MRCLFFLISLFLLSLSKAQVVDYWYTTQSTNWNRLVSFYIDDFGNPNTLLDMQISSGAVVNSVGETYQVSSPTGLIRHGIVVQQKSNSFRVQALQPGFSNNRVNSELPYSFTKDGKYYFVWFHVFDENENTFFGQKVDFEGRFGTDYPIQIIVTDDNYVIEKARRLFSNASLTTRQFNGVFIDNDDRIHLGYSHNYGNNSPSNTTVQFDTVTLSQTNIGGRSVYETYMFRLDKSMGIEKAKLLRSTTNTTLRQYPGAFTSYFARFPFSPLQLGVHAIVEENTTDFRLITAALDKDYNYSFLDTFRNNFIIGTSYSFKDETVFTSGNLGASETIFELGNDRLNLNRPTRIDQTKVLCTVDQQGEVEMKKTIEGVNTVRFFDDGNRLWLKVFHYGDFNVGQQFFERIDTSGNVAFYDYICFNAEFEVVQIIRGPAVKRYSLVDSEVAPVYANGAIHDIVNYMETASFETDNGIVTIGDNNRNNQLLYVKLNFRSIPIEKPEATITRINCNSVRLEYPKTDAEFYTVLHSEDSVVKELPTFGSNFNYSLDYSLTKDIGKKTRVLYQGDRTRLAISNLPSGKRHHFTIVPGNGTVGQTVYNLDSIDTLSIYIPPSIWQDSIAISPNADSSICKSDTLSISAKALDDLRWMDGVPETERLVLKNGNYSFRTKAPDQCIIYSDTVNFIIIEEPEILGFDVSPNEPYCEGDTVIIQVQTDNNYQWESTGTSGILEVATSGTYKVTASSAPNCIVSDSIEITINPKPTFSFIKDTLQTIDGEIENLEFNSNASNFLWIYQGDSSNTLKSIRTTGSDWLNVVAFSSMGCSIKDSLWVTDTASTSEAFPNAFTPNGDGLNDEFTFLHPDSNGVLTVFDRGGAVVHSGKAIWDGKKNGEVLPVGVYYYIFRPEDGDQVNGTVLLMN
jgi:gliding motility-associated-like protein